MRVYNLRNKRLARDNDGAMWFADVDTVTWYKLRIPNRTIFKRVGAKRWRFLGSGQLVPRGKNSVVR